MPSTKPFKKGDPVIYIKTGEKGIVTGRNQYYVFVKFKKDNHSKACAPRALKKL